MRVVVVKIMEHHYEVGCCKLGDSSDQHSQINREKIGIGTCQTTLAVFEK